MTESDYVEAALRAWAPTYPRRATMFQQWAMSLSEAVKLVVDAENDPDNWPFISTYSFPNGHTKDNAIPRVDRLFIDFDVPDSGEYRGGKKHADAWARDMSRLLVRTRKVARFLLKANDPGAWQVALSGHKGVHLDLTFPPISDSNGDLAQFKNGMSSYADTLVEYLKDATGLDDLDQWVDVSSSDMGRLRRVPNTKHLGATEAFGEDRFCVPVTLRELAEIKPADYIELTRSRRSVTKSMWAEPSEKAGEVLTQRIRNARSSHLSSSGSTVDPERVSAYTERSNDSITVEDLPFVLSDRPCILEFVKRDDAFSHGASSHLMEMFVITHMIDRNVPIETMIDFFSQLPDFDESYTRSQIEQYISRNYNPVNCDKVWEQAEIFCLKSGCRLWINSEQSM